METASTSRAKQGPSRSTGAAAAAPDISPPMSYIESSALVAAFIEADRAARKAIRSKDRHITSALTLAEAHRAVLRARLTDRITAEAERRVLRGLQRFARRCDVHRSD